jgi:hypothetical protein
MRIVFRQLSLCALLLFLFPAAAQAQAPVVTPAGDPPIRNDSVYALAVDSAKHAGEPYVLLLDDGIVRYETDGRGTRTYRQVTQILTQSAVEQFAEHAFSYAPGHQRLTVNWIRVVRPDGSVVSDTPPHVQDADVPATLGDPVYTDEKVRRYSLSGVAPGTIVDWSYTLEELKPQVTGDFLLSWSVHNARLTQWSRYIVDLPATMRPHVQERNLTFKARTTTANGRRVTTWETRSVAAVEPEEFASDSNGVYMSITITGPITWEAIGRWYAGLATDRTVLAPAIAAKLPALLTTARTADDTLAALQRWVAQDIRYVSIALGLGGYEPRTPGEVVASGYGDCKDKATLFIAAANRLGFKAYPVLLNSGGNTERALPAVAQFDHAIAAVDRPAGRRYVDLTAALTPYGELPPGDQGQFALVVHPDGSSEQVILPEAAPSENLQSTRMTGALAPDGYLTVSVEERMLGTWQYMFRRILSQPLDTTRRDNLARAIGTRLYPDAQVDSLQLFDGRDLSIEPRVAFRLTHALAARPAGTGHTVILSIPLTSMRYLADAAARLEARKVRRFPVDAAKVLGPMAGRSDITLALPTGWRAELPRALEVNGKWGRYVTRYTQDGQTLHVVREFEGARGVYPPTAVSDLVTWLRAVSADDVPYIVIESGASAMEGAATTK